MKKEEIKGHGDQSKVSLSQNTALQSSSSPWGNRSLPVICVTGPMAAGKNLASDILASKGWACVDADKVAHQALDLLKEEIVELHKERAQQLGISLLLEDGSLNRRGIGSIVFDDKDALTRHEAMLHPKIEELLIDFVLAHPNEPVVLNATVLYKLSIIKHCSAVIFIDAPMILRYFRAKKRDKMVPSQIFSRFRSQFGIFAKYKNSNADTYRVWNVSRPCVLERKLERILTVWNKRKYCGLLQV